MLMHVFLVQSDLCSYIPTRGTNPKLNWISTLVWIWKAESKCVHRKKDSTIPTNVKIINWNSCLDIFVESKTKLTTSQDLLKMSKERVKRKLGEREKKIQKSREWHKSMKNYPQIYNRKEKYFKAIKYWIWKCTSLVLMFLLVSKKTLWHTVMHAATIIGLGRLQILFRGVSNFSIKRLNYSI